MTFPFHEYDTQGPMKPASKRPLSEQELGWIGAILRENKEWTNVDVGDLFADGMCACGCQTVHLVHSSAPQNPKRVHMEQEIIGEIWIETESGATVIVALMARNGTLCELEVVYGETCDPFPSAWREVSRRVYPSGRSPEDP